MTAFKTLGFFILAWLMPLAASAGDIYFNVAARKAELQKTEYSKAREYCAASALAVPKKIPEPIASLYAKTSYGNDNRLEPFTLAVMILGGRALAGDADSASTLRNLLLKWAEADALVKTKPSDKTHYPLQRYMIPVMVNFAIVADGYSAGNRQRVENWLDKVVRPLNTRFGNDVDRNNHRYLADSAVMVWGAYRDDKKLYQAGEESLRVALKEARADGSLPLENRRGARANWYLRHALANLTLIAEVARQHGDNLYEVTENDKSFDTILNYFISSTRSPLMVLPDAAENYKPGPSRDAMAQDFGYLDSRGQGRHYMAFAEALIHRNGFSAARLKLLLEQKSAKDRPLLDDYFGGNASCFFWQPDAAGK
jgi:poly(beta-D-mannuronate) lyase